MMKILKPTIYGTSAMTLYSYVYSKVRSKNFIEPEILAILFQRISPIDKKSAKVSGWLVHYLIGLFFVMAYIELWESNKVKPTVKNGVILGAMSGVIGVYGWKAMFRMHPAPPKLNRQEYFQQLIIAHMYLELEQLMDIIPADN